MTPDQVQEFADENNLDVSLKSDVHYRLLDEYGAFILDVYFKHNKKGIVIRNSVLKWSTQKWYKINTTDELKNIFIK